MAGRKADEYLEPKEAQHGKRPHQKMKPYLVLQYLLRETDENHVSSAHDIMAFLEESGIEAERRSVYKDVEEINVVSLMMEEECDVETARAMLIEDETDDLKLVVYDKKKKGFYIHQRHFDVNDIRLLAECVYAAKFVSEGQAKRLVNVVCDFVSEHQAERIRHTAFLADRVKTNNRSVMNNISIINDAMSRRLNGVPHEPEKICFKYLHYQIGDLDKQVEAKKGDKFVVSPFHLMINDGNYYLLAYNEKQQRRTYRVDRMREVAIVHEPRDCEEEFQKVDIRTHAQRVFSMFGGETQRVSIRFINPLMDVAVERFGITDAIYSKVDDSHFEVSAIVETSEQFYGWLLGFGKRVKLVYPEREVKKFTNYVDKIRSAYEDE